MDLGYKPPGIFQNSADKYEDPSFGKRPAGIFNSDKKHFSTSKWDPLKRRSPSDLKSNKKHCFEWATSNQHGILARPVWKRPIKQQKVIVTKVEEEEATFEDILKPIDDLPLDPELA
jgi:hypothetical protein